MKRIFVVLVAAIAVLTLLTACTEKASDESTVPDTASSVSTTETSCAVTDNTTLPENISANELFEMLSADGWVALYCGDLLSGGEIWSDFLNKTSKGESASVLIVNYYPPLSHYDKEPSIFLEQISFNGSTYEYRLESYPSEGDTSVSEYKYIVKYELEKEDVYVLVNKDTYTYEQIERAYSTSISTELIDFQWLVKIPK